MPRPILALLASAFLAPAFLGAGPPAPRSGDTDPAIAASDALLLFEDGRTDEALARLTTALEYSPRSPLLFQTAAAIHASVDQPDEAYYHATLAREYAADDKAFASIVKDADALIASIRPAGVDAGALLEDYAQSLFGLAQTCQRKKLYANAVDLLARCEGTRFENRARTQLDKLFENKKAVESLLDSGIEIPAKPVTKKSPEWIAREDAKHESFENPWEIKTDFYTVETNMGYEMAQSISLAMEQMNRFYRKVFQYKERGGSMRRCVLRVYASRAEFDSYEGYGDKPTVGGFFSPLENRVATYDHRTDGGNLAALWSTLFHESSHQFTRAISTETIPAWLNEGTASYFEGAVLLPSGYVETNGIPEQRLAALLVYLRVGEPKLRDVVSYFRPGSYPGEYYPFGWGLVYYIQNYENDRSERIYLPLYQKYLESYKSGGKHDPFERFVEYFVGRARVPGVETFEAFEAHWKEWIQDLGRIHYGGAEVADRLLERARKEVADGKHEYAVESYRQALQKRPDDVRARFEMAQALAEIDQADGAVMGYRAVVSDVRSMEDREAEIAGFDGKAADAVIATALDRIRAIDRNVSEGIAQADASFATAAADAARACADAGFPRAALQVLSEADSVIGGDGRLRSLASGIQASSGIDLRRWRRPAIEPGLELWQGGRDWKETSGLIQVATEKGLTWLTYREDVPARYRYEVTILPTELGETPVYGLCFGANETGVRMFAVLPSLDLVGLVGFEDGLPKLTERFGPVPEIGPDGLQLAVEIGPDGQDFYLAGERVGESRLAPEEVAGRIGLCAQQITAEYADPRLFH